MKKDVIALNIGQLSNVFVWFCIIVGTFLADFLQLLEHNTVCHIMLQFLEFELQHEEHKHMYKLLVGFLTN